MDAGAVVVFRVPAIGMRVPATFFRCDLFGSRTRLRYLRVIEKPARSCLSAFRASLLNLAQPTNRWSPARDQPEVRQEQPQ